MAGGGDTITIRSYDGSTTLYQSGVNTSDTIGDILGLSWNSGGTVTALAISSGGTPLPNNTIIANSGGGSPGGDWEFYDVTPQAETITGFYLDGTKYEFDGGGTDYSWVEKEAGNIGYDYSAMQGPAPEGFHVPLITEWKGVETIMSGLGLTTGSSWRINLHIPFAGYLHPQDVVVYEKNTRSDFWTSSTLKTSSRDFILLSSYVSDNGRGRATGNSIRCFKDSYIVPDSSWTVIQGTLGSAGIFWNQSEGLISVTDGSTGYTIMDKNLGATTVYNDGDTLSEANCGKFYQWGNNYGFSRTGSITTSSTQVDASAYGPGNYYSSSTFIKVNNNQTDWSSVKNDNLRGGVTGVQPLSGFELSLRTITREPSDDFTLIAPSSIKDGEEYVLRCVNVDSHTMTLGKGFTNPFNVDLTLSANATDQFVFLAVGGTLELQPQVVISNGTVSQLVAGTAASSDPTTATLITNS